MKVNRRLMQMERQDRNRIPGHIGHDVVTYADPPMGPVIQICHDCHQEWDYFEGPNPVKACPDCRLVRDYFTGLRSRRLKCPAHAKDPVQHELEDFQVPGVPLMLFAAIVALLYWGLSP